MQNNTYLLNFWCAKNYGANLTAYALYKTLEALNQQPYLAGTVQGFDAFTYKNYYIKKFIEANCKTIEIKDLDNSKTNTLIVGSDQVFNPSCAKHHLNNFLLDFSKIGDKKIAYSASFGVDKEQFLKDNDANTIEKVKNGLKSFDFISVREKSGLEICKDTFGIEAEWIIDPVFLLKKEDYIALSEKTDDEFKNKFKNNLPIVSYVLTKTKAHEKAEKYLSKKYNSEIIDLSDFHKGVEDWLYAINNCKFLITNSYHATCFAIIFHKPFICIAKNITRVSRFESIFELLNINKEILHAPEDIYTQDCIQELDFKAIDEKIEAEKTKSLNFLKTALETPTQITQEKLTSWTRLLEQVNKELKNTCNLKYQLKHDFWELWLCAYFKLPQNLRNIIRKLRGKKL